MRHIKIIQTKKDDCELSTPSRPIVIRLPSDLAAKFDQLTAAYGGLQKSVVLRMLLSSVLEKPIDEQMRIIDEMIKGKKGDKRQHRPGLNRVSKD